MELKYVWRLGDAAIWNNGFVELFDFSKANTNLESRKEAVVFVASQCYGVEVADRDKLYTRLLTESAGGPSSALEFIREFTNPTIERSLRNNMVMLTHEDRINDNSIESTDMMASFLHNSIATFRIKIPIFIARQVMRHRSFAYQEQSRRYQDADKAPFEFWDGEVLDNQFMDECVFVYNQMIKQDVPAEIARGIIPQAAYTTMFMQGDLNALVNYFNVRLDAHAQTAHRELAEAMLALVKEHQPKLFGHINNNLENSIE